MVNTWLYKARAKEGRMIMLCLFSSTETLDVFAHEDAVYGLSVSPVNDNIFASSSDDGRVLIWDIRESSHGGKSSRREIIDLGRISARQGRENLRLSGTVKTVSLGEG